MKRTMNEDYTFEELKELLVIDVDNLEDELCNNQLVLFHQVSEQHVEAQFDEDRASLELKCLAARLATEIRSQHGDKISDAAVKAEAKAHPKYRRVQAILTQLKAQTRKWAELRASYEGRACALIQMVEELKKMAEIGMSWEQARELLQRWGNRAGRLNGTLDFDECS